MYKTEKTIKNDVHIFDDFEGEDVFPELLTSSQFIFRRKDGRINHHLSFHGSSGLDSVKVKKGKLSTLSTGTKVRKITILIGNTKIYLDVFE